jgi:hypothetical protein
MWRSQGVIEAYVYVPTSQKPELYLQPGYVNNDEYGESIWRGVFKVKKGEWNNIELYVKLNDKNQFNGHMGLTVNDESMIFNNISWCKKDMKINGLMMHTFFGGSDDSWATPTEQTAYFKDFTTITSKTTNKRLMMM